MSGVTLTSRRRAAGADRARQGSARRLPAGAAGGARASSQAGDTLMFFTEFYENGASNPHKVDLKAELRGNDGRVVLTATEERSSAGVKGGGGYGLGGRLPLSDLAPGLYVLHVEGAVALRASRRWPSISRDIQVRGRWALRLTASSRLTGVRLGLIQTVAFAGAARASSGYGHQEARARCSRATTSPLRSPGGLPRRRRCFAVHLPPAVAPLLAFDTALRCPCRTCSSPRWASAPACGVLRGGGPLVAGDDDHGLGGGRAAERGRRGRGLA